MSEENVDPEHARIVQKVAGPYREIFIEKTPAQVKREFQKLANEEFSGHYGFTLKHLMEVYKGLMPMAGDEFKELSVLINNHEDRITELESRLKGSNEPRVEQVKGNLMKVSR